MKSRSFFPAMIAEIVHLVGNARPRRWRAVVRRDRAGDNVVDVGKVAGHPAFVEDLDRLSGEDRPGEQISRHIRPSPWTVDSKKPIGNEGPGPIPENWSAATKSILTAANMPIIGGHHVLALQSRPEGSVVPEVIEKSLLTGFAAPARGATGAATGVDGRATTMRAVGLTLVVRPAEPEQLFDLLIAHPHDRR